MESQFKKPTLKRKINEVLRSPQRTSTTRLSTRAVCIIETFKNKKIVTVYADIDSRFLIPI